MQSSTLRKKAIMAMSIPLAFVLVMMKVKDVHNPSAWITTEISGRLGSYMYLDMDKTVRLAMDLAEQQQWNRN